MLKRIFFGRTSRLQYFVSVFLFLVFTIVIESPVSNWLNYGNGLRGVLLFFPFLVLLTSRRYHDVGLSFYNDSLDIKMFSYLHVLKPIFKKGESFENKYGKPPKF